MPFPDVLFLPKDKITFSAKTTTKNFTILSYTVLAETPENLKVNNETIKQDTGQNNTGNLKNIIPLKDENGKSDIDEINQNESYHGEVQNSSNPDIVDYTPDFSTNKKPVYPAAAKRMRQQGSVTLKITANAKGAAKNIKIVKSSGYTLLDNAAIEAAEKWDFSPIVQYGKPTVIRTKITFKLREKGE